jgi:small-conductance mechanosensitive channel
MEVGGWVASDQSSGRIIKVPNGMVLNTPIINYNRCFPYIWNEIPVKLTPESNRKEAEQLLLEIAQNVSLSKANKAKKCFRRKSDEIIVYRHLDPVVYLSVHTEKPAGIILTLRYLCEPRQRRDTENIIWAEILDAFIKHPDIHLAFETN